MGFLFTIRIEIKKKTIDDLILSKPSVCFYIRWWESNMV